uniref:Uncharacterized protein n=1 Tax=Corethron hystrix TaxID=216773 RepID=A0A7S1FPW6_9STRA
MAAAPHPTQPESIRSGGVGDKLSALARSSAPSMAPSSDKLSAMAGLIPSGSASSMQDPTLPLPSQQDHPSSAPPAAVVPSPALLQLLADCDAAEDKVLRILSLVSETAEMMRPSSGTEFAALESVGKEYAEGVKSIRELLVPHAERVMPYSDHALLEAGTRNKMDPYVARSAAELCRRRADVLGKWVMIEEEEAAMAKEKEA